MEGSTVEDEGSTLEDEDTTVEDDAAIAAAAAVVDEPAAVVVPAQITITRRRLITLLLAGTLGAFVAGVGVGISIAHESRSDSLETHEKIYSEGDSGLPPKKNR